MQKEVETAIKKVAQALVKNYDIAIILTIEVLWLVTMVVAQPIHLLLGLFITLFGLGYLLTISLFPSSESIGAVLRLFISVVISLAMMPILGMIMKYTGYSIDSSSAIYAFVLLLMLSTYGAVKVRGSVNDPFLPPMGGVVRLRGAIRYGRSDTKGTLLKGIAIILAIAMILLIVVIINNGGSSSPYTEFYVLSDDGNISNYTQKQTLGQVSNFTLGVVNHEGEMMDYTISIWLVNANVTDGVYVPHKMFFIDRINLTLEDTDIGVTDDYRTQWENKISLTLNMTGEYRIWFLLTDQNDGVDLDAAETLSEGEDQLVAFGYLLDKALRNEIESLYISVIVA